MARSRRLDDCRGCTNDWSAAELHQHRRALERALRPRCQRLRAPSRVRHPARAAARRRHPRLRRRRAHASDRQPVAHRSAEDFARDQWLVVDGLRHAGRLCGEAGSSRAPVVCVVGDGGFQMTAGELATGAPAESRGADDRAQRRLARPDESEAGAQTLSACRVFTSASRRSRRRIISACLAVAAKTAEQFREALDWAFALDGPSVIEAFIDAEVLFRHCFRLIATLP